MHIITVTHNRQGEATYALIKLKSRYEAQAFIGAGEQDVDRDQWVFRVKPIAPSAEPDTVCCRVLEVRPR